MPWNKSVEIVAGVKVVRIVIPSAKVGPRRWQSFALPKQFQQPLLIHAHEQLMVLIKLYAERAVEQLHL